jgi:hypothetical protein
MYLRKKNCTKEREKKKNTRQMYIESILIILDTLSDNGQLTI